MGAPGGGIIHPVVKQPIPNGTRVSWQHKGSGITTVSGIVRGMRPGPAHYPARRTYIVDCDDGKTRTPIASLVERALGFTQ